ncbi:Transcriptional regulator, luxR family, associated with agmatine catabolism [Streptococcus sp. DD11]|uniref:helix-turn-helix transcriptional regulator n=1 Tax=Streptococcus sp. DD11 TaxID=1777879 RepID=UPI0007954F51|nr:helix-turn-helix transcriptional regulator [Streptococcus sp. DD11]KXT85171.1 Transcriptional regulator, luxR family, associated with agmatine catabolism [Streptococcus sp. DD11]
MDPAIVYIYNTLLLILYSTTLAISLVNYFKADNKKMKAFFLILSLYFAVFILDNSVISMTELIASFASGYNQTFQGTSFIKTSIFLAGNFCQLWLFHFISKSKIKGWEYLLLAAIFLFMLLPIDQSSSWRTYLYYLPNQLWLGCLGIRAWHRSRQEVVSAVRRKYLKIIGSLTFIFSLLILAEDTFIIFHVDSYSLLHSHIINRSFSENIFSISLSMLALRYFLKDSPLLSGSPHSLKDRDSSFMTSFFQNYRLTEREQEICQLLLAQKHNQEIAEELYLSVGTVKTHIHNIYIKTDVRKREELFSLYHHYRQAHS